MEAAETKVAQAEAKAAEAEAKAASAAENAAAEAAVMSSVAELTALQAKLEAEYGLVKDMGAPGSKPGAAAAPGNQTAWDEEDAEDELFAEILLGAARAADEAASAGAGQAARARTS